ncbi:MAG: hypothetical protein AABY22_06690, partial [Nanoarchaeota archaeon]
VQWRMAIPLHFKKWSILAIRFMKKIILETYDSNIFSSNVRKFYNSAKSILKDIDRFLIYILKYAGIIIIGIFALLIILHITLALDTSKCQYNSKLIHIESKCSQLFLLFHLDGQFLTLIGADYDYNSWGILLDWNDKLLEQSKKMNLTKNETIEIITQWNSFTNQLNDAHNIIYRQGKENV